MARSFVLFCAHVHKKYKRGLAENGKIGVCEMARKKCFLTLEVLRATIQALLTLSPLPRLLEIVETRPPRGGRVAETVQNYIVIN